MYSFVVVKLCIVGLLSGGILAEVFDSRQAHPDPEPSSKILTHVKSERVDRSAEERASFWLDSASKTLKETVGLKPNEGVAKNVIMFLGDGMSIPTTVATRVYQGGDENFQLSFEKFPHLALSKTYCVDNQVADSACSATAYLTGVKANKATIGVTAKVKLGQCQAMANKEYHTKSIAYYSQLKGKSTGLVTKAKVTDASPAGVYAHTARRFWETDQDILKDNEDPKICTDIATQLIEWEEGKQLNVIMGGGRSNFLPETVKDVDGTSGYRKDGVDLIARWRQGKDKAIYVENRQQLLNNVTDGTDYLLGLFTSGDMPYDLKRDGAKTPSLAEMTEAAIKVLSKNEKGYFLFVEGALIDHAHHATSARYALDDTVEMARAVELAVNMTSESDTLIVVTADHAHTMSISGYPDRGHDVLGVAAKDRGGKAYTTLSYANGPGFVADNAKEDLVEDKILEEQGHRYRATVHLSSETHGGDDVAIYARGPWSHLFRGVLEQHMIPHIMSYASCVGEGATVCDTNAANTSASLLALVLTCLSLVIIHN